MGEPRPPTAPSRYPDCEIGIGGASQNRMLRIESVPGAPKKNCRRKDYQHLLSLNDHLLCSICCTSVSNKYETGNIIEHRNRCQQNEGVHMEEPPLPTASSLFPECRTRVGVSPPNRMLRIGSVPVLRKVVLQKKYQNLFFYCSCRVRTILNYRRYFGTTDRIHNARMSVCKHDA